MADVLRPSVRRLVIMLGVALSLAGAVASSAGATAWSYDRLMRELDRAVVRIADRRYRIDRSLVVCNGIGPAVQTVGLRRWARFTCTEPVFRGGTIVDITFGVRVTGAHRFVIAGARYGP